MHDLRYSGPEPVGTIDDDIRPELSVDDLDLVEKEYPPAEFSRPRRYLPPIPSQKTKCPQHQPQPEPESKLARRAKLGALAIVTALLAMSLIIAANLAQSNKSTDTASAHRSQSAEAIALSTLVCPDNSNDHHASHVPSTTQEVRASENIRSRSGGPPDDPA